MIRINNFNIIAIMCFMFVSTLLIAQPTITQQPTNQQVAVGQSATFNITATSANPMTYQWYKDAVVIPGATSATYNTPATVIGDNGTVFYCVVSDLDGSVQSNNATLLVGEPPVVTTDPMDTTVTEGESVSFSVAATGSAPLSYQWRRNGADVPGATSTTYNIASATVGENGDVYACVVTNDYGITLSNNATLTVNMGVSPVITMQPEDNAVLVGQTATFMLTAEGSEPLQYQWKKNGANIGGANSNSYTTPSAVIGDDGSIFTCEITNNFGSVTSSEASLFVTGPDSRVTSGLQVLYEFEEQGGEIVQDLSGNGTPENLSIITPDKVAWTPNGLETFSSIIRKSDIDSKIRSSVSASNEITLEVWIQPEFTPQNSRRIFTYSLSGSFRNFSIISEGDHYEFRLLTDSTDLNGLPGISSSSGTQVDGLTHLVYTRDSNGEARVYVNGNLDATAVIPGGLSRFKDNYWLAIGSEPLGGLEWRGMYYLTAVYDRALTEFEVEHNYDIGTPFDEVPAFTIQPEDQFIIEGEALLLDSYAVSVLPVSYQWRKNGVAIPGATGRKLNLSNVGVEDNGSVYTNTATTSAGSVVSNSATVYVTSEGARVNDGAQVLYTFREGDGTVINDVSGVGSPLNFSIFSVDAVEWQNNGLKINSAPSVVTTSAATKVISALKSSNEMSIEAWIASSDVNQASPSRILTLSTDENSRNFSLGQNNDSYEVNLRTPDQDNNGNPPVNSSAGTVSTSGFDHVVFTRASDGTAKFFINGTERVSTTVTGDFSNWNESQLMSLGNEFGVDHHWKGLVNLIAVFDRPLSNSEVLQNFNFGPYGVVVQPSNLSLLANDIGSITITWDDNSTNEDGFIIERGVGDPVVYTQIGSVGADSTTFTDDNIVDNTVYTYRVKGFYSLGESEYSNELVVQSVITPIEAPSELAYTLDTDGFPILTWTDNSFNETNFVLERRASGVGSEFAIIDTVAEDVTSFKDLGVSENTTYIYRILAYNEDTVSVYSGEKFVEVGLLVAVDESNQIPTVYSLEQNYPNPFNPTTSISFGLPHNSSVSLVVYNLLGQQVMKLINQDMAAGKYDVTVNAENLTSGLYIYSITAKGINGENYIQTKKMLLLK